MQPIDCAKLFFGKRGGDFPGLEFSRMGRDGTWRQTFINDELTVPGRTDQSSDAVGRPDYQLLVAIYSSASSAYGLRFIFILCGLALQPFHHVHIAIGGDLKDQALPVFPDHDEIAQAIFRMIEL